MIRAFFKLPFIFRSLPVMAQAGAIPYEFQNGILTILLITSRQRQRWVFPKGTIEPGENSAQTAIREAREEAGVEGHVHQEAIHSFEDVKLKDGSCRRVSVDLHPLRVTTQHAVWPEQSKRYRQWVTLEEGLRLVRASGLKRALDSLEACVRNENSGSPPGGNAL